MIAVLGVPVPVVEVIHVALVGDGLVAATWPVLVLVPGMAPIRRVRVLMLLRFCRHKRHGRPTRRPRL
jgi:hypothetical protein